MVVTIINNLSQTINKVKLFYMGTLKVSLKLIFFLLLCQQAVFAQDKNLGKISGSLESNANFFIKDATIGANNTPQYEHQLFGADTWLNVSYLKGDFEASVRFDFFQNSILPDPKNSFTDEGIGRWYLRKKINKLDVSVGHIYDQIGSGVIFRAYEERPLFIDNALLGARVTYDLAPDWQIKAFTGRQKNVFEVYESNIRGLNLEGYISGGEGKNWSIAPGFGAVARTQSGKSIDQLAAEIGTYSPQDTVSISYNTYALTLYNTLSAGPFSWYIEGAYKSPEVFYDEYAVKHNALGADSKGKFVREAGAVIYSSLSYAGHGFGISIEGKRTENFKYRTNPFVLLNRGAINFLPPMTRINSFRLNSRYQAATQELGEQAFQADISYRPSKKILLDLNFSNITNLSNDLLYREIHFTGTYKKKRKWQFTAGLQLQTYNQEIYEVKPGYPLVEAVIPFGEFLYKINRKKAIRLEAQYMSVGQDEKANAKQDYGDWAFGLAELTLAPHWTFTVSDMYNINPGKNSPEDANGQKLAAHYPRFDIYYSHRANRYSISYVKQVEGIVCSGGICRLEPAFSGIKVTVNSSF